MKEFRWGYLEGQTILEGRQRNSASAANVSPFWDKIKVDLKGLYRNVCRLLAHRGGTLGSNRTPNQPLSTPESSARISWPGNFFIWTLIKHSESPKPKHQHTQGIWNHAKLSSSLPLYYNQALRFCVLAITSRNWGKWSQKNGVIVTVKCDLIEEPPCLSSRH